MKHTEVYQKGEDNGWLTKQNFWFDPEHEHGFQIQYLNSLYPERYFETDHVKAKISQSLLNSIRGCRNPFWGKSHTEETKKKLSEGVSGEKHHFYGKKHSEETKEKMKLAWEKRRQRAPSNS